MNKTTLIAVVAGVLASTLPVIVSRQDSPYSGQQKRQIKALSEIDIEGYLEGRGMGLAKAAELNGIPGPMHVLELKEEMKLTPEQERQMQRIFNAMQSEAKNLGAQIVRSEAQLDKSFADRTIKDVELTRRVNALGELYSKLRTAHLVAHLRAEKVLSPEQVQLYSKLRGYDQ